MKIDQKFFKVPNALLELDKFTWPDHVQKNERDFSSSERLTIIALLHSRWDGNPTKVFPSHKTLAKYSGLSVPTIKRCLVSLRTKGVIDWGKSGKRSKNYTFTSECFNCAAPKEEAPAEAPKDDKKPASDSPRVKIVKYKGSAHDLANKGRSRLQSST